MEIEICNKKTLESFPNLQEQLQIAVELSGLASNNLCIRILCGDFLQPYYELIIWKLDPRGMRIARIMARYRPPGIIELDIALGRWKPRLATIIRNLFHEIGHHKSYLEQAEMSEKVAEHFATLMMKHWRVFTKEEQM